MFQCAVETHKVEAVTNVFNILGDRLFEILRNGLQHDYNIELAKDSLFALEELHIALQRMLGECSADLIMQDIYFEISELEIESLR